MSSRWCGKEFSTCKDSITLGSWRADLCSEKCFQAKIIGLDLAAGNISPVEARGGLPDRICHRHPDRMAILPELIKIY